MRVTRGSNFVGTFISRLVLFRRCVFDSCACDEGGDCECLCTVFATYAHECNAKGVPLKWRRQDLCRKFAERAIDYRNSTVFEKRFIRSHTMR